jgi:ribosomal protein L11 methyltransferase
MAWLRVAVELPEPAIESVEAALESRGAVAVTVSAADDEQLLEPDPGTVPLWQRCRLTALFEPDADVSGIQAVLAEAGAGRVAVDELKDEDWENRWRQHATYACFADRLYLVPRDVEPPAEPALKLDPGLAFGSGSHPTTRLCLDWLAREASAGATVLDYGCGSGVLGLAALKLGCASVLAIDHDPQALLATRDNAAYNALADDRLAVGGPETLGAGSFDLVLANILANPLIELAPVLGAALAPWGTLVLSGMLESQWPAVAGAYEGLSFEPPGIEVDEAGQRWVRLVGRRPGAGPVGK